MVRNGAVCFASQKQRPPSYPTFSFSFVVLAYSASDVHQSRLAITLIRFHERPPLAAVAEQRRPCARRHKWEQQTWGRCGFGNADGRRPLAGGKARRLRRRPAADGSVVEEACLWRGVLVSRWPGLGGFAEHVVGRRWWTRLLESWPARCVLDAAGACTPCHLSFFCLGSCHGESVTYARMLRCSLGDANWSTSGAAHAALRSQQKPAKHGKSKGTGHLDLPAGRRSLRVLECLSCLYWANMGLH